MPPRRHSDAARHACHASRLFYADITLMIRQPTLPMIIRLMLLPRHAMLFRCRHDIYAMALLLLLCCQIYSPHYAVFIVCRLLIASLLRCYATVLSVEMRASPDTLIFYYATLT